MERDLNDISDDEWLKQIDIYYDIVLESEEIKLRISLVTSYKNEIAKHNRKAGTTRIPEYYKRHVLVAEKATNIVEELEAEIKERRDALDKRYREEVADMSLIVGHGMMNTLKRKLREAGINPDPDTVDMDSVKKKVSSQLE